MLYQLRFLFILSIALLSTFSFGMNNIPSETTYKLTSKNKNSNKKTWYLQLQSENKAKSIEICTFDSKWSLCLYKKDFPALVLAKFPQYLDCEFISGKDNNNQWIYILGYTSKSRINLDLEAEDPNTKEKLYCRSIIFNVYNHKTLFLNKRLCPHANKKGNLLLQNGDPLLTTIKKYEFALSPANNLGSKVAPAAYQHYLSQPIIAECHTTPDQCYLLLVQHQKQKKQFIQKEYMLYNLKDKHFVDQNFAYSPFSNPLTNICVDSVTGDICLTPQNKLAISYDPLDWMPIYSHTDPSTKITVQIKASPYLSKIKFLILDQEFNPIKEEFFECLPFVYEKIAEECCLENIFLQNQTQGALPNEFIPILLKLKPLKDIYLFIINTENFYTSWWTFQEKSDHLSIEFSYPINNKSKTSLKINTITRSLTQ